MSVGQRIRERRIALGWTQEELAKRMGYKSKSTINKIEMGVNDITQNKIIQFAKVMDTTIGYMMEWDRIVEQNKELDAVMDAYQKTDDATRTVIKRLLGVGAQ